MRRRLTASADRELRRLTYQFHDGSTGTNAAVMGLGIKRGMLLRRLREIAIREEAIPTGIVEVPALEPGRTPGGLYISRAMPGFTVNLASLG